MLFLPESVYQARRSLLEDMERGRLVEERAWRQALELDPDDHIALVNLGRARRQAGDFEGAEQLLWRAILAHPCQWHPYLELGELAGRHLNQDALAAGLTELAVRKLLLDEESLERIGCLPLPDRLKRVAGFARLSTREQLEVVAEAMRLQGDLEPPWVTARLEPHRLLCRLQEEGDLEERFVDALLAQKASISPLLIGVLRGWAQDQLPGEAEHVVENALALLGEMGDAAVIPHLLEFAAIAAPNLSGAAQWALDRLIVLQPEESLRVMMETTPSLGEAERAVVLERLLRHPKLDPAGALFARLAENVNLLEAESRGRFLLLLLGAMAAVRGRAGIELAGDTLRKTAHLLPRKARRECDELLQAFGEGPPLALPVPLAPPWTVYDICAGNACWEDDEPPEQETADDFVPPRPALGRNDPCWCGSGKKYKKCHLDQDHQPAGLPARPPAPAANDEFARLRTRLGDFLKEAVPDSDVRAAVKAFFGGEEPDEAGLAEMVDWILHDWVSPRLGRTLMQEYLRRHGDGLPNRERDLVESWSRSYIGLYEVQQVRSGSGVTVKNLVSNQELFIHDVSLSKTLVRWDGLLTRVVDGQR